MADRELAARLGAAYGAGEWLIEAPVALLRALADELPRMQAEESLRLVAIGSIASGTAKKHAKDRLMGSWHRLARGAASRVVTGDDLAQAAAALDIPIVKERAG